MSRPAMGILLAAFSLVLASAVVGGNGDKPPVTQPASGQPSTPARLELSGNETMDALRKYVGREVTACGYWGGPGKVGSYVRGKGKDGESIYINARYAREALAKCSWLRIPDGAYVEICGELHFLKGQQLPLRPPGDTTPTTQPVQTRFYFDVEEASFRFPKK